MKNKGQSKSFMKVCNVVFELSAIAGTRGQSLPGWPALQEIPLLLTHSKVQSREQLKISPKFPDQWPFHMLQPVNFPLSLFQFKFSS